MQHLQDIDVDVLAELLGESEEKATLLDGQLEVLLTVPNEAQMIPIASAMLDLARISQEVDDDSRLLTLSLEQMYAHGHLFVNDGKLTNEQFKSALRKSNDAERNVVHDHVLATINTWISPLTAEEEEAGKKK